MVQWSQLRITLMRSRIRIHNKVKRRIRICIKIMRIRNLGFPVGEKVGKIETYGNAFLAAPAEIGKCWWRTAPGSRTTARYLVSANKKNVHIFIVLWKYTVLRYYGRYLDNSPIQNCDRFHSSVLSNER